MDPQQFDEFNPNVSDIYFEWRRFYWQFVQFLSSLREDTIDEQQKKDLFLRSLGTNGVQYIQQSPYPYNPTLSLENHYILMEFLTRGSMKLKTVREHFYVLKQSEDQTFSDFHTEVIRCAERCCFINPRYIILGLLIKGVKSSEVSHTFLSEQDLTVETALIIGNSIERRSDDDFQRVCESCGGLHEPQSTECAAIGRTCLVCRQSNHLSMCCPAIATKKAELLVTSLAKGLRAKSSPH